MAMDNSKWYILLKCIDVTEQLESTAFHAKVELTWNNTIIQKGDFDYPRLTILQTFKSLSLK